MTFKSFISLMWFAVFEIMGFRINIFDISFSFLQLFIFGALVTSLMIFLFRFGGSKQ